MNLHAKFTVSEPVFSIILHPSVPFPWYKSVVSPLRIVTLVTSVMQEEMAGGRSLLLPREIA